MPAFKKLASYLILFLLLSLLGWTIATYFKAKRAITKLQVEDDYLECEIVELRPSDLLSKAGLLARKEVRALAWYDGSLWAATAAGLLELDKDFSVRQTVTSLDGLPSNDLTCLAVYNSQLFFGSAEGYLMSYDRKTLREYRLKRKLQRINSLQVINGQLYIAGSGLFAYDGENFRCEAVKGLFTAVAESYGTGYFGTFADGLIVRRHGYTLSYGRQEGLQSERVVSIIASENRVFVATDMGLAEVVADSNRAVPLVTLPSLASFAIFANRGYLLRDTGELFSFELDRPVETFTPIDHPWPKTSTCKLLALDNQLVLLSNQGSWIATNTPQGKLHFTRLQLPDLTISDNAITSLAVDEQERIWIGYFSKGLDIFSGNSVKHIEDEYVREVNALLWDRESKRMFVATSAGLVIFDEQLQRTLLNQSDGIISKNIVSIGLISSRVMAAYPDSAARKLLALSTAAGLSIGQKSGFRNYTTLNGLASSSVYAACEFDNKLYVATLGGLAVFEYGRIVKTYSTFNSPLAANWITALLAVADRLYIGTYGGGISVLDENGIKTLELGRCEVNFNAIVSDEARLYVGTLDDGLWIMDLVTRRWKRLRSGLPSGNVTAIARKSSQLYIGTMNGIIKVEVSAL
ncbi:MAG: hypothetical protein RMM17_02945 [Acidobacteriota bacterium]|nr:hypothetical protein [Blastocatellia bacterium]MDW8411625.1 hypothetical protein [Acidobacteriota bacterium]